MQREPAAGGGWEMAIDAGLAARLQSRAVRPGISDPAHGRTLAMRLQRATAPTLADDVAHRYGTAALGGERPPIVHAVPSGARAAGASAATSPAASPPAASDTNAAGSQASASPARAATPAAAASMPVIRAAERAAMPAFPRVRPLAEPAVQRQIDPAAATAPVVQARSAASLPPSPESPLDLATAASASADGARPAAAMPRVSPAPTRLRRQLAAEHAEAESAGIAHLPVSRALRGDGRGGAAYTEADFGESAATGTSAVGRPASALGVASAADAGASFGTIQRITAGPSAASVPPAAVQRRADAGARASEATLPAPAEPARSMGQVRAAFSTWSADGGAAAPQGEGGWEGGGRTIAVADAAVPARAPAAARDGGGARPVVAPRTGTAGVVQRMVVSGFGGAMGLLAQAAGVAVGRSTRPEREGRTAATTAPTDALEAELPTVSAAEERRGGAGDTEAIAGQVYELLARRLEAERKQRGW